MKFEIKGNKEEIKKHLEEFIKMAEEEYEIHKQKVEGKLKEFGVLLPEFKMGYFEEEDRIILFNTLPAPKVIKIFLKPAIRKMESNLKGYFKERGISVEVKFLEGGE